MYPLGGMFFFRRLYGKMQQFSVSVYVKCQMVLILLSKDTPAYLEPFWEIWQDDMQIMFYHYGGQIINQRLVKEFLGQKLTFFSMKNFAHHCDGKVMVMR